MSAPVDVLAFFEDVIVVRDSAVTGMSAGSIGGVTVDSVKAACGRIAGRLSQADEARAAVAELARCSEGLLLALDLKHPAKVVNNWRASLRAAVACVPGKGA